MIFRKHLFLLFILIFSFVQAHGVSRYSIDEQENIRIYERSSRAVVNISNIAVNYDFYYRAIPAESGSGTGFLINKSGIIVTNYHVVEGCDRVGVDYEGEMYETIIIAHDPKNDLAVLKTKINAKS